MSQCPFANLLNPDTYAQGMPYESLKDIRQYGPVVKIADPLTDIPYWAVVGQQELDFVSKNPALFSSAMRTAFPMEIPQDEVDFIHCHTIINMDPPRHQKVRRIVREAFTPKRVNTYEPAFRAHAKQIIDRIVHRGECEFCLLYTSPSPRDS